MQAIVAPAASRCLKHERRKQKIAALYTVVRIDKRGATLYGNIAFRLVRLLFGSLASVSLCHIAYILSVPKCLCGDRDSSPRLWRPDQLTLSSSEQSTMVN